MFLLDGLTCKELASTAANETSVMSVLHFAFVSIQVVIVVVLIVLAVMDLFKAVTSGDDKAISKSIKTIGVRLVAAIAVFIVPALISAILTTLTGDKDNNITTCLSCLVSGTGTANANCQKPSK